MKEVCFVGLGGFCGAICRFLLNKLFVFLEINNIYATLLANCLAASLIGFLSIYLISNDIKLLLITGFLGSLSTFSTFNLQTIDLLEQNLYIGLFNMFLNLFLTFTACFIGIFIAKLF